jgi:hypothetical protein
VVREDGRLERLRALIDRMEEGPKVSHSYNAEEFDGGR